MRNRLRWIIGACVVALLITGAAAVWLVPLTLADPADPISEDAFAQLRVGMTDQEVEAVFRNMPGYREDGDQFMRRHVHDSRLKIVQKEWVGPHLTIVAEMDQSGRVTAISKAPGVVPVESLTSRVNRWFDIAPRPVFVSPPDPQ